MGSSYTKDEKIDLYLSINKQYYLAGETVEGQVYLNAKATCQYSNICIKLEGIEYVYWTTGSGKNRRSHSNRHLSYNEHILLVDFHGTVNQGQYMFPFSLRLPSMMAGSFYFSANCFIKYALRTELVHMTEEKNNQRFEMFLNIIEPPRMAITPISMTNSVHSQCCGCCCDYGIVEVSLSCNSNFVLNGDTLQIKGYINNSQGKQKIEEWKILLEERRTMISSGGRVKNDVINSYIMHQDQNTGLIPPGGMRQFNFNTVVPHNILSYTAIGRVVSRYFLLRLYTNYGCCTEEAGAILHLIVHSRTPMIVEKKSMPPPPNWNPQVFQKIIHTSMKPYIYNPLPQLGFLNMPGNNNIKMGNVNQSSQQTEMNMFNQAQYIGFEQNQNFEPPKFNNDYLSYTPTFYNQGIFSEVEQQQQGYYPPNFGTAQTQNNLVRKL